MSVGTIFQDIAEAVKTSIETAGLASLGRELTVYEDDPRTVQLPAANIIGPTAITRRGIDSPEVQLGAREWVSSWSLTLMLDLQAASAMTEMRALLGGVIEAIDTSTALVPLALDAVIESGELESGKDDSSGREYLIFRCDLIVQTFVEDD